MKHLELKKQLLDTHKPKLYGQINKELYHSLKAYESIQNKHDVELTAYGKVSDLTAGALFEASQEIEALCKLLDQHFTEEEQQACSQLNHARRNRALRLRKRIEAMRLAFSKIYFVCFTFSNKYINLKDETLREYVQRCLHKYSPYYIANPDYGKRFGRLHYHCITTKFIRPKMWSYGSVHTDVITDTPKDREKVAKYAVKYSNHALKETNKTQKCLYSKQLKQLLQSINI